MIKWILLYFLLSALVELFVMTKSPRVYRSIMENGTVETGFLFVGVAIVWPLLLAGVLVGFVFWSVGKGLERLFKS